MSASTVQFPSKAAIVSYLEQHPMTSKKSNPYLSEQKIIDAVAKFFADQRKTPMRVNTGVMLIMYDVNELLGLPESAVMDQYGLDGSSNGLRKWKSNRT